MNMLLDPNAPSTERLIDLYIADEKRGNTMVDELTLRELLGHEPSKVELLKEKMRERSERSPEDLVEEAVSAVSRPNKQESVESKMLLQDVPEQVETIPMTGILKLMDGAEKLFKPMEERVLFIFNSTIEEINKVRNACDVAEEALRLKRNDSIGALKQFVYAVQEIKGKTDEMQKTIGDVLAATERMGG